VIADLTRPETLADLPPAHFIVLSAAPDRRTPEDYRRIYVEGLGNFFRRLRENPPPRFIVYLSSAGVYGDRGGAWVDEATAPEPDHELGTILVAAENQVLNSGFPAAVFRLGGIYGPGRNRLRDFAEKGVRPERRDFFLNLIHRDDILRAIPLLFNSPAAGSVYLGVDDEPVRVSDFNRWLARELGMTAEEEPTEGPAKGKRCRNNKLKALGFDLKYRNFREGYQALMAGAA
jgi:nucleoside-diphosphate-sugar epimerase